MQILRLLIGLGIGDWGFYWGLRIGARVARRARVNPKAEQLKARTHRFFVRVIRFCESLPRTTAATSIAKQLVDAAGATDSNYRAACHGRSTREFISKIGVAAEEADECLGWLQALLAAGIGDSTEAKYLADESDELTRIFVASGKTAERNRIATKPPLRQSPIRHRR